MKIITLGILALSFPASALTISEEKLPENRASIQTYLAQPCQYWRYDGALGTYTCSSTNLRIYIPDGRDVQNAIRNLEKKIEDLEARIRTLEQKPE